MNSSESSGLDLQDRPAVQKVVDHIKQIDLLADTDEQEAFWSYMRSARHVGQLELTSEAEVINQALINLIETNHRDIASNLMTPSSTEVAVLGAELLKLNISEDDRMRLNDTIMRLHEQKAREFTDFMMDRGFNPYDPQEGQIINRLRDRVLTTEEVHKIPSDFWPVFKACPDYVKDSFIRAKVSLSRAADVLQELAAANMLHTSARVMDIAGAIDDVKLRQEYIASLKEALQKDPPANGVEYENLCKFGNPSAAVELKARLKSVDYAFLNLLMKQGYDPNELVQMNPKEIIAYTRIAQDIGTDNHELKKVLFDIKRDTHQSKDKGRLRKLVEAFSLLGPDATGAASAIITQSEHPVNMARFVRPRLDQLNRTSEKLRYTLLYYLGTSHDAWRIERFFGYLDALESHQLSIGPGSKHAGLFGDLEYYLGHPDNVHDMEEQAAKKEKYYLSQLVIEREQRDPYQEITLKDMPQFETYFARLGLPQSMAEKIFKGWNSFSLSGAVLGAAEKRTGKKITEILWTDVIPRDWEKGVYEKHINFEAEFSALEKYIDEYGIQEAIDIHQAFGITHFRHSSSGILHDQLMRWRSGEQAKNVIALASEDHNAAFSRSKFGNTVHVTFDAEGTFLFEVQSRAELSSVMRKVGEMERKHGRDPAVDTVVIAAHGSPDGVFLNSGSEVISVRDYEKAASARSEMFRKTIRGRAKKGRPWVSSRPPRPNDYARHLGGQYRIILIACSTAADNGWVRKNIAETMSDVHGRKLYGFPTEGGTTVEITPRGDVIYNHIEQGQATRRLAEVYTP